MKLASYLHDGRPSFGIVRDGGIIDVPRRSSGPTDLAEALAAGIDAIAAFAADEPDLDLGTVTLLPTIPKPAKILCVGLNYRDHAAETGAEIPSRPTIFVRFADSLAADGEALVRPRVSHRFDYEGELAVIIGRTARHVPAEQALDHVAGYSCFNDGTIRDWQGHSTQFTPGKNFLRSGAMGPWMITADEIVDPASLAVTTRLNGAVVQEGRTADMVFSVPDLIAYLSTFTALAPGDVIATGTPAGVGYRRRPPLYLKDGDRIEVTIEGIGTLANPVIDEV